MAVWKHLTTGIHNLPVFSPQFVVHELVLFQIWMQVGILSKQSLAHAGPCNESSEHTAWQCP